MMVGSAGGRGVGDTETAGGGADGAGCGAGCGGGGGGGDAGCGAGCGGGGGGGGDNGGGRRAASLIKVMRQSTARSLCSPAQCQPLKSWNNQCFMRSPPQCAFKPRLRKSSTDSFEASSYNLS